MISIIIKYMSLKSKKKNIIIDDTDNTNNVSVDKIKELKKKQNHDNKEHYLQFEHYCVNLHQTKYDQIAYHWNNIPEDVLFDAGFITDFNQLRLSRKRDNKLNKINSVQEYGLDGIAIEKINNKNIYHGLQMKLWSKKLTGHDLGTFWQALFFRLFSKSELSRGYLYHSCKLECNVRDDIKNINKIIANEITDFYDNIYPKEDLKNNKEKIIRDYQQQALNNLNKKWTGIKSLILPCGTGKTFITCKYLENQNYKNIFIFSPLRVHAKQFLKETKQFLQKYNFLLANSDNDGDLNVDSIKEILNKKSVISTTFKSAKEIISLLLDKINIKDSILIIDEAHNLINDDDLNDVIKKFNKVLLVTATPPTILNEKFGSENIFKYSMHDAIKNKYICDYKIYLPLIINDKVSINKPEELDVMNDELCKKGLFVINGMLKTGSRRCIIYLTSIEDCKTFSEIIEEIMKKYHYLPFWTETISSDVNSKKRCEILNNFQKDEKRLDTLKFLCSVNILDEGVDIVKCDSVFITKIGYSTSDIKMVQRICRANRLDKYNINKVASCFLWCDDLNKSVNSLQLLKENDIDFIKKISIINSDYEVQDKNDDVVEDKNKKLVEFINVKCLSYDEMWEMKYNLLVEYVNKHNKMPVSTERYKNLNIGGWVAKQKEKINNINDIVYKKMSKNEIIKKSLDEYLKNKENKLTEDDHLKIFLEFVNTNKRVPIQAEKYKNVNIGSWLNRKKSKINNKENKLYIELSKNEIVKKCLNNFLENKKNVKKKLTFDESLEILFEFINKNNKLPSSLEQYKNVSIGNWLYLNKRKIIKNSDAYNKMSKNKLVKKLLDDYINEKEKNKESDKGDCNKKITKKLNDSNPKDVHIQLSFDETLNILEEYINKYNRMPTSCEKYKNIGIGVWVKKMKGKISDENNEMYKKMSQKNKIIKESLDDYLKKKNKKLTFNEVLKIFMKYVGKNNKIPSRSEKYDTINLCTWFANYKKKIKNDDELYKIFSINKIVKEHLDDYLKKNKRECIPFNESLQLFLEYIDKESKIPIKSTKYKEKYIGKWLAIQKRKIKSKEDEIYKLLSSKNILVKKSIDDYLEKKENMN